jgi:hypothetical protein
MIQNNFIHEFDLNLDIEQLTKIALNAESVTGRPSHHRLVTDNPYTMYLKNKYPFLSPVFNVYNFIPGRVLPIHTDADRLCAMNIPICYTEDSFTMFYSKDPNAQLEYDEQRIINYVKSRVEEVFRFTLTRPTLINTTYPHSVVNNGTDTRVIISWSVLRPMTFEECVENFPR